jgi:hypothetical protein
MQVLEANKSVITRKLVQAMQITSDLIEKCDDSDILRLHEKAFTRERKLGPRRILNMVLLRIYHSLQLCIDSYFEKLNEAPVTKQAFSKARKLLNSDYVRQFADKTSELAANDETKTTYNDMAVIAIDGSDIAFENTAELKREFGCSGSKKNAATGLSSIAFDPLKHAIYDCQIDKYATDERTLAKAHVKRLLELNMGGSLLLFDRWYPSAEFIPFLFRAWISLYNAVRNKFNLEADAVKNEGWIHLTHNEQKYPVRVIKVTLLTGEVETLFTSVNKKQLPAGKAGELYFERWKVETAYDLIKSKLEL